MKPLKTPTLAQTSSVPDAVLHFARLRITATCVSVALLGAVSSGTLKLTIVAAVALCVFWNIHANSINDYFDRRIDQVNLPHANDRPLVRNDITMEQFWVIHLGSLVACLACSLAFGLPGLVLTVVVLSVDYAYSMHPFRITDRTFLSPITLAFCYGIFPFALGVWSTQQRHHDLSLDAALVFAFAARMLLKDFRDTVGDERFGKRTFLLRFGATSTCIASWVCWFLATLIINAVAVPMDPVLMAVSAAALLVLVRTLHQMANSDVLAAQLRLVNRVAVVGHVTMVALLVFLLSGNLHWPWILQETVVLTTLVMLALVRNKAKSRTARRFEPASV